MSPRARRIHGRARTPIQRRPDNQPWPQGESEHASAESDARRALERFLAGFGVAAGEQGRVLTERLLSGARIHHHEHPQIGLAECAMLHAEQQFEAWLSVVLATELPADQSALSAGRAAFLACGGPTAWSELVLVHDNLPDSFVTAMGAAMPPLSPMPAPATMAAQALDSWSIAETTRAALDLLVATFAWAANTRPLFSASIKLAKPWS